MGKKINTILQFFFASLAFVTRNGIMNDLTETDYLPNIPCEGLLGGGKPKNS